MANAVKITNWYNQAGANNVRVVTWTWTVEHTTGYRVVWKYTDKKGTWFVGEDKTETTKNSTYTFPANATKVSVQVKPISETYTKNRKEVAYFTAEWSKKTYTIPAPEAFEPATPSAPSVTLTNLNIVATLDNISDAGAPTNAVEFQLIKNDVASTKKSKIVSVTTRQASVSWTDLVGGAKYKVRCRSLKREKKKIVDKKTGKTTEKWVTKLDSAWSDFSENYPTRPAWSVDQKKTNALKNNKAVNETSVRLDWYKATGATNYTIAYLRLPDNENVQDSKKALEYFDHSNLATLVTTSDAQLFWIISGLEEGHQYYFRVRGNNDAGNSEWSGIRSIVLGEAPSPPTIWFEKTVISVTEGSAKLYWVHNSEDGSSPSGLKVNTKIGDGSWSEVTVTDSNALTDGINAHSISIPNGIEDGTEILCKARTKGIKSTYSEYSDVKTVKLYEQPSVDIALSELEDSEPVAQEEGDIFTLHHFPLIVDIEAMPQAQNLVSMAISILAQESYEDINVDGTAKIITPGDVVFQRTYGAGESSQMISLGPSDLNLQNGQEYSVAVETTNGSGMDAKAETEFTVEWDESLDTPNAEVIIDEENLAVFITPYYDGEEEVTLGVYRRQANGELTEIISGLPNDRIMVTDPHPALDYARYRITATSVATGFTEYYDLPNEPIGESGIVITWDERWSNFDEADGTPLEDEYAEPPIANSMLILPYNVNINESVVIDKNLVSYIGRKHPVSYYGTQVGETAKWTTEVPKTDVETIYQLRRLSSFVGDCYVREPNGNGYWASIDVSLDIQHDSLTVPVSFSITRVEGGV